MPRVIFQNSDQAQFLQKVKSSSGLTNYQLATIFNVSNRTFRDWLIGKYTISYSALGKITNIFNIPMPTNIQIVDDYWYGLKGARNGALRRMELYGPPGTPEGRKKGGVVSQRRRKENPDKYRLLGCNVRKKFNLKNHSIQLAEAVGIILGDGAITKDQVRISVSRSVDRDYSEFIKTFFERVFGECPSIIEYEENNVVTLTISGVELVEKLKRLGLKQGDKVKQQVDIPEWIKNDLNFSKTCVRGLFDTDGGCYFHKHTTNGLTYKNFGLCFSNSSLPLIKSFSTVLTKLGIKHSITKNQKQIFVYDFNSVKKYFQIIGSNNPKNIEKFTYYSTLSSRRVI